MEPRAKKKEKEKNMTHKELIAVGKLMAKLGPYLQKMTAPQLAAYVKEASKGDDFVGLGFAADGSPMQTQ